MVSKKKVKEQEKSIDAMEILESMSDIDKPSITKDAMLTITNKGNVETETENINTQDNVFQGFISIVREFLSKFGIKQKSILNQYQIMGIAEIEVTNKYKKRMFNSYNRVDKSYADEINERMISLNGVGRSQIIALSNQVQSIDNINNEYSRLIIRPPMLGQPLVQQQQQQQSK